VTEVYYDWCHSVCPHTTYVPEEHTSDVFFRHSANVQLHMAAAP